MSGASAGPTSTADTRPKVERRHTKEYRALHLRCGRDLAMSLVDDRTNADSIIAEMNGGRRWEGDVSW